MRPLHRDGTIREELRRCRSAVEAAGVELSGRRRRADAPALRTAAAGRVLREEGYQPVTWSVTGYDWRAWEAAKRIGRRAVRAKGGDIVLVHDGNDLEPAADRSRSLEATRMALEHHTPRGTRFVTVPELAAP